MIVSFRHKGLKRLYEEGDRSKLQAALVPRIERVLALLDRATSPDDMGLPGFRLHPLKGDLNGFWSVTISGNWRIIWRHTSIGPADVDLIDYH